MKSKFILQRLSIGNQIDKQIICHPFSYFLLKNTERNQGKNVRVILLFYVRQFMEL